MADHVATRARVDELSRGAAMTTPSLLEALERLQQAPERVEGVHLWVARVRDYEPVNQVVKRVLGCQSRLSVFVDPLRPAGTVELAVTLRVHEAHVVTTFAGTFRLTDISTRTA